MTFFVVSFIAGALTVLAPCVLPLLPVVIGSSASGRSRLTPYIVVGSLALSVILFTFLLKVSTAFVAVPPEVWTYLSGGILILFGLTLVFPALWESVPGLARLSRDSNKLVGSGYQKKSVWGDVLIGAALGPVFSTCSPTYFVILASVLPASFALGTLYLLAYVAGLSLVLVLIALLGQRFADRLTGVSDSHSVFKRVVGVCFVILGLMIAFGYEKKLEASILSSGFFDVTKIEQGLLERAIEPRKEPALVPESTVASSTASTAATSSKAQVQTQAVTPVPASKKKIPSRPGERYKEIVRPDGFVNTAPITIGQFVGEKIILVDFLTYSCINCQRTFPYLNTWYEKYREQGLVVIGIHTPEFAFEHQIENVRKAMGQFGITHPVVLDNEYATWNAFGNHYWPRKYLIDIYGNIVYDHIGEGAYNETEAKIRELLAERASVLGAASAPTPTTSAVIPDAPVVSAGSPETYFGASRNQLLGNGTRGKEGVQTFSLPRDPDTNTLYLGGTWILTGEYAKNTEANARILYRFNATNVYIVAGAVTPTEIEIIVDGKSTGMKTVETNTLYPLVSGAAPGTHTLEIRVLTPGLEAYTFTFG